MDLMFTLRELVVITAICFIPASMIAAVGLAVAIAAEFLTGSHGFK